MRLSFSASRPRAVLSRLSGRRHRTSAARQLRRGVPLAHTGAAAVPYAQALRPGAAYTGSDLERDLRSVIERVHPTWVLAPTPLDAHADHRATGELVIRIMDALGNSTACATGSCTAALHGHGRAALHPSARWIRRARARALPWQYFALSPEERAAKANAIRVYDTQMRLTSSFMLSFVKRNEIYSPVRATPSTPAPLAR